EDTRLAVGAVEDCAVGVAEALLEGELGDARGDELGFFALVAAADVDRDLAFGVLGPEALAAAVLVVADRGGRGADASATGAEVAPEGEDVRAGEVFLEEDEVADVGAAPAVDRLVVVADGADLGAAAGEELEEAVLRAVRVLELVDHQVLEAAADVLGAGR